MPRLPRIDEPGLIYHIGNRGTNRQSLFLKEADQQDFMRFVLVTREKLPFKLHNYSLMTNHFHFLLQTLEAPLSETMQFLESQYARLFNYRYNRSGHLFQGRFFSIPVQTDAYYAVVNRYIALNPVRAGMVAKPEDYPWSSYGKTIRGEPDPLINTNDVLEYFGGTAEEQRQRYKAFVDSMVGKPEPITERVLRRMRAWGNLSLILKKPE